MTNGFTKKSMQPETLGSKLKKIRQEKEIDLEKLSNITKIQVKYLKWLEEDNYKKLPVKVYVEGFIKNYARALNENFQDLIEIFNKEQEIRDNMEGGKKNFTPIKPLQSISVIISPKTFLITLFIILISAACFYVYGQARFIFAAPSLQISSPESDIVWKEKDIEIAGISSGDSQISINGQTIYSDEEGKFEEKIILREGLNTIKITAENRLGKKTEVVRNVIYNSY